MKMKVRRCIGSVLVLSVCLFPAAVPGYDNWFEIGLVHLKAREYDRAITAFSRTIEVLPHDFEAYNNRAVAWFGKHSYDRAIMDCTRALQIREKFPEAYCNRSIAWFYKGDFEKSEKDATRALALDPLFFEAFMSRGAALTRQGDYAAAVADYEKALSIRPGGILDTTRALDAWGNMETAGVERIRYPNAVVLQLLSRDILASGLREHIDRLKAMIAAAATPRSAGGAPKAAETLQTAAEDGTGKKRASRAEAEAAQPSPSRRLFPYVIHVSSFQDPAKALRVARTLLKKGDAAFTAPVTLPPGSIWYRVYVGWYETEQAAESASARLFARKFRYAKVLKRPYALHLHAPGAAASGALEAHGYMPYAVGGGDPETRTGWTLGAFRSKSDAELAAETLLKAGLAVRPVLRGAAGGPDF